MPLCNPNPNRVKAKKRDRGGGSHCLPVATATAREKCRTDTARKEQDPFGSENREGSRHSSRTLTQELNRSSSELGKESVSGKRTISDELKQRKAIGSTEREKERFRINPNPKRKGKSKEEQKNRGWNRTLTLDPDSIRMNSKGKNRIS